jgi:hypothetical protein
MKAIAIFLLFLGMILIIKGYYSNKYKELQKPEVIIKYVSRDEYEAQLSDELRLAEYYKGMFEGTQPNIYDGKININNK